MTTRRRQDAAAVQVCCVQAGQQQLLLSTPLAPGWVQEEGLLGADQALLPVGGGAGHRVHHGCEGVEAEYFRLEDSLNATSKPAWVP